MLYQAGGEGQPGEVGAPAATGFVPDPVQVRADRAHGDEQLGRDLRVGVPARDQRDEFTFPRAEPAKARQLVRRRADRRGRRPVPGRRPRARGEQQGVLGGPVKTPFGYYVYEVKAIHPSSQQSLAQVKETVKSQLASTQQQTALTKFVKEFESRWKARTECRVGYVMQRCKQYTAPKTTPATPVPTPAN